MTALSLVVNRSTRGLRLRAGDWLADQVIDQFNVKDENEAKVRVLVRSAVVTGAGLTVSFVLGDVIGGVADVIEHGGSLLDALMAIFGDHFGTALSELLHGHPGDAFDALTAGPDSGPPDLRDPRDYGLDPLRSGTNYMYDTGQMQLPDHSPFDSGDTGDDALVFDGGEHDMGDAVRFGETGTVSPVTGVVVNTVGTPLADPLPVPNVPVGHHVRFGDVLATGYNPDGSPQGFENV